MLIPLYSWLSSEVTYFGIELELSKVLAFLKDFDQITDPSGGSIALLLYFFPQSLSLRNSKKVNNKKVRQFLFAYKS